MSFLAIINSSCLDRLAARNRQQLLMGVRESLQAEIIFTRSEKDMETAVKKCVSFDNIISCGGDGTFFSILNSVDIAGKRFGVIPLGTGNGLAHDLGIRDFRDSIFKISKGNFRDIDLMEICFNKDDHVTKRYAASTVSLGFFAEVANSANLHYKKLGRLCYPVAAFLNSLNRQCYQCLVSFDGSGFIRKRFTNLLINNTAHVGHMRIFKGADIQDGKLDIWLSKVGFTEQLIWYLAVITNTYFYYPGKQHVFKKMEIMPDNPVILSLDGEVFYSVKDAAFAVSDKKASIFC